MAFKRFEQTPNSRVRVFFENGAVAEGTIIVGADGTTSRVRRQYIPHHVTLLDTDAGAIYGKTPRSPELEKLFPPTRTTTVVSEYPRMSLVVEPRGHCGEDTGVEQETTDYIGWVLSARARHLYYHCMDDDNEDFQAKEVFALPPERIAQLSLDMTRSWHPKIRALLEHQASDWCVLLRVCSMSPDLDRWAPSRVTLLGDAVHTMAPAGLGCNTALYDAQALVNAFKEHGVNVSAVASYERELRAAGREGIALSLDACAQLHGLPKMKDMAMVR
jgi:2-polyprenyl-6-methoxyphenol hydroxylase-like FAD-dependent oxidoreductase